MDFILYSSDRWNFLRNVYQLFWKKKFLSVFTICWQHPIANISLYINKHKLWRITRWNGIEKVDQKILFRQDLYLVISVNFDAIKKYYNVYHKILIWQEYEKKINKNKQKTERNSKMIQHRDKLKPHAQHNLVLRIIRTNTDIK